VRRTTAPTGRGAPLVVLATGNELPPGPASLLEAGDPHLLLGRGAPLAENCCFGEGADMTHLPGARHDPGLLLPSLPAGEQRAFFHTRSARWPLLILILVDFECDERLDIL
jgi:hypothetical protein